ncbi:unnamed protein product [Allacma fusca]|uniref:Uncharacterized protein n=1 Tax=Allacma fusca TaxID=39272 RepID=A0A8J2PE86_9HEXA|nr:unnamed protein product [Allacma fusca]
MDPILRFLTPTPALIINLRWTGPRTLGSILGMPGSVNKWYEKKGKCDNEAENRGEGGGPNWIQASLHIRRSWQGHDDMRK